MRLVGLAEVGGVEENRTAPGALTVFVVMLLLCLGRSKPCPVSDQAAGLITSQSDWSRRFYGFPLDSALAPGHN